MWKRDLKFIHNRYFFLSTHSHPHGSLSLISYASLDTKTQLHINLPSLLVWGLDLHHTNTAYAYIKIHCFWKGAYKIGAPERGKCALDMSPTH